MSRLAEQVNAEEGLELKLARPRDGDIAVLAYGEEGLRGFCSIDAGTPPELVPVVARPLRRQGLGRRLLGAARRECGPGPFLLICEERSTAGMDFARALGLEAAHSEHRMWLRDLAQRPAPIEIDLVPLVPTYMDDFVDIISEGFEQDAGQIRARAEAMLEDSTVTAFVGISEGRVITTARLYPQGDDAFLYGLVVAPRWRGRGVGRAMVEAIIGEASRRGAHRLGLEVETDNDVAIGLYTSRGFQRSTTYRYLRGEAA